MFSFITFGVKIFITENTINIMKLARLKSGFPKVIPKCYGSLKFGRPSLQFRKYPASLFFVGQDISDNCTVSHYWLVPMLDLHLRFRPPWFWQH